MALQGINSTNLIADPAPRPTEARLPVQVLNQQDFLKLLVAQMAAQDPMEPRKDTDFISQMATFSSLEQAKTMQADIAKLRQDQQVLQANALLGRTVEINTGQTPTGEILRTTGLISSVQVEAGMPKVVVNGQSYDLTQLMTIKPTGITDQPSTP
ncbi:MAG: flagellar hook assembly protein FlgD [Pedosphaera sp.]|nr:flagellar hook assembly protein FlgD [Pedosphaera sp.]